MDGWPPARCLDSTLFGSDAVTSNRMWSDKWIDFLVRVKRNNKRWGHGGCNAFDTTTWYRSYYTIVSVLDFNQIEIWIEWYPSSISFIILILFLYYIFSARLSTKGNNCTYNQKPIWNECTFDSPMQSELLYICCIWVAIQESCAAPCQMCNYEKAWWGRACAIVQCCAMWEFTLLQVSGLCNCAGFFPLLLAAIIPGCVEKMSI